MCHYGFKLKERLFPLRTKSRENYIDIAQLINKKGTGILQQIEPIETEIVNRGQTVIDQLRGQKTLSSKDIDAYYRWVDDYIVKQYAEKFKIHS